MRTAGTPPYTHTHARERHEHVTYLGVVDLGDEGEGVAAGLSDVADGELHSRLDALADATHKGRLVHGHQNHDGHVRG